MNSYTQIIAAKNGTMIPLRDSVAFHSKYNPEREAESFPSQFDKSKNPLFFIILGLCGGYHILSLRKAFPDAKIVCAENTAEDIEFLKSIPAVSEILGDQRIIVSDIKSLKEILKSSYLPSLHGDIMISSLRQWTVAFPEEYEEARQEINDALKEIGADFSVQKHFGKIWQKNILQNLAAASYACNFHDAVSKLDTTKTAAIISAGPSLNESCKKLIDNRDEYCIIATDTAYSALLRRGIESDFSVTVDGQLLSHEHYMRKISGRTTFIFDLCASNSTVRKIVRAGAKFIFIESGHPLSVFASRGSGQPCFAHMNTGSGTVTIAAANFAMAAGFKKIETFGADFSYISGQPYARGTYFDVIYRKTENRIKNAETAFTNLLYRTEIKKLTGNSFTTDVLESYKNSFELFMAQKNFRKTKSNTFELRTSGQAPAVEAGGIFDFGQFREKYINELKNLFKDGVPPLAVLETSPIFSTLIPFYAALDCESPFLAYSKTLEYTRKI